MKRLIEVRRVYDLPYEAENSGQPTKHIDLRIHPSAIQTIPELRGRPGLAELVSVLNRGPFMTHGSAFGLAPPREPGGKFPLSEESRAARCWCTSYVTFSFWYLAQNIPQNYQLIYEKLKVDAHGTELFFVIQSAYFMTLFEWNYGAKYDETNATVCLLWVSGWGDTSAVAESRWRNVTKTLVNFFRELQPFTEYGPAAGITVSQHMAIRMPRSLTEGQGGVGANPQGSNQGS
ncbi:MAG: hypothetical protein K2X35_03415 [Bryobacteraceae bacterium]|nr:hypothetical protein [Bryobacteraceae bacterium]